MKDLCNSYSKHHKAVVEKALGETSGTATLHLHPRNKGAHAIGAPPSLDGTESVAVPLTRLDAELAGGGWATPAGSPISGST